MISFITSTALKPGDIVKLQQGAKTMIENKKKEKQPQFFHRKCCKCGHEGWMSKFCTVCGNQIITPGEEIAIKMIDQLSKDVKMGKILIISTEQRNEPITIPPRSPFDPWEERLDTGKRDLHIKYRVVKK